MSKRAYLITTFSGFDGYGNLRFGTHTYAYNPDDMTLEGAMDERGKRVFVHQEVYGWNRVKTTRIRREVYSVDGTVSHHVLMDKCEDGDEEIMPEVRRYQMRPTLRNREVLQAVLEDHIEDVGNGAVVNGIIRLVDKSVVRDGK